MYVQDSGFVIKIEMKSQHRRKRQVALVFFSTLFLFYFSLDMLDNWTGCVGIKCNLKEARTLRLVQFYKEICM